MEMLTTLLVILTIVQVENRTSIFTFFISQTILLVRDENSTFSIFLSIFLLVLAFRMPASCHHLVTRLRIKFNISNIDYSHMVPASVCSCYGEDCYQPKPAAM